MIAIVRDGYSSCLLQVFSHQESLLGSEAQAQAPLGGEKGELNFMKQRCLKPALGSSSQAVYIFRPPAPDKWNLFLIQAQV